MTTGQGEIRGGIDEELFYALLGDGVPRNQAIRIASIPDVREVLDFELIRFLSDLTTDASGRFIQGTDVTIEQAAEELRTPEVAEWARKVVTTPANLPYQVKQYNAAMKEYQDALGDYESLSAVPTPEEGEPKKVYGAGLRAGKEVAPATGTYSEEWRQHVKDFNDTQLRVTELWDRLQGLAVDIEVTPDPSGSLPSEIDAEQWLPRTEYGRFQAMKEGRVPQPAQARDWPYTQPGREGLTPQEAAFESALGAETLKRREPEPEVLTYQDYQAMGLTPVAGESQRVFESRMATAIGKGYKTAAQLLPEDIARINRMRTRILAPSDEPQIPWQRDPANIAYLESQKPIEETLPFLQTRVAAVQNKPIPSTRRFRPPARWLTR